MRASRPLGLALATVVALAAGQCTIRNPDYRVDDDSPVYRLDGGNPDFRVDGGCTRRCQGRPCGPDSCGGSCGTCLPPTTCDTTGHCQLASSCGAITNKGCCAGTTLKHCQNGVLGTEDCSKDPQCGWNASKKWYECGTSGHTDGKSAKACP